EIDARHLIQTLLRRADLLFVFGTREDVALRAETACRLWRGGVFRWAVVSGGRDPGFGAFGMRRDQTDDGRRRGAVRSYPGGASRDKHRRERDVLATHHRCHAGT